MTLTLFARWLSWAAIALGAVAVVQTVRCGLDDVPWQAPVAWAVAAWLAADAARRLDRVAARRRRFGREG